MYDYKVIDDSIPKDLHKAVYDYCHTQRWYSGYRELPPLDHPGSEPMNREPHITHNSIIRAPFAMGPEHLGLHKPIEDLFNYMNENVFDGKMLLDGFCEPSPGLNYGSRRWVGSDVGLNAHVPFCEDIEEWKQIICKHGARAYMQAIPFESVRNTRIPHRDWGYKTITDNEDKFSTVMFVANLNWGPNWFGEFTLFADGENDLYQHKGVGIGYPEVLIANKPGRILVQDGRQLHATKAVSNAAPEPAIHINFRVRFD
jgi:hypothetical protein